MIQINLPLEHRFLVQMLDLLRLSIDKLDGSLAVDPLIPDTDPDLLEAWEDSLKESLKEDCACLFDLFYNPKIQDGIIEVEDDVAEGLMRACSAIRLKMRNSALKHIPDEDLELGDPDYEKLTQEQRQCYICYRFLADFQGMILLSLDPACDDI